MKLLIFLLSLTLILSCKKDDFKTIQKEYSLSQNSAVNMEIKNLKGQLDTAKDDSERADIHTKIAVIQAEKGDTLSTMKSAREAVKYQPNEYMSRYLLGKSYVESGRFDDAITELKLSISYNSRFAPSHFELGNAYYKKVMFNMAAAEYRLAVSIDPKHINAYNNLGVLASASGNGAEAERSFKKIIEIDPKFAVAYKNLGILYDTKMNNKQQAILYYKKYLEAAPDNPDRQLVRAWLQVLGG